MAPIRPFPTGSASTHCAAGCRYQSFNSESAGAEAHVLPASKIKTDAIRYFLINTLFFQLNHACFQSLSGGGYRYGAIVNGYTNTGLSVGKLYFT